VNAGEIHGLLGPNGAGKSTLLRVLFGLVRPDAGRVALFGAEQQAHGSAYPLQGVAGFVDRPNFYAYLSARQMLRMLAKADGLGADDLVDAVLAAVGLTEAAGRRIARWSTGMLQRLGIAAALLRRPRLLVLDEPTEGLDPSGSRDLLELIRSLAAGGVSVLLSSHDMAEVDAVCDAATILHHGRVARSAFVAALRAAAPPGRHRLVTTDDGVALRILRAHQFDFEIHPRGGITLQVGPAELHQLGLNLGRAGVSIQLLEQEVAPLTALFYALTDDARPSTNTSASLVTAL
jgi:ABC-2 type transport system ATP-binding protein